MDPNEALRLAREAAANLASFLDRDGADEPVDYDMVDQLVTAVQSLDQWLTRGDFLPSDWNVTR